MDTIEYIDGEQVVARDCLGSENQTVCQECVMTGCKGTVPCTSDERKDQRNVYFLNIEEYNQ